MKRDAEHIYQQVSKGTLPAGIEYWQPLFFSEPLPPLFSYFPASTLIVNTGDLEASAERFQNEARARFEKPRRRSDAPAPAAGTAVAAQR
ncbi:hypothetical protein LNP02_22940 [Klebsiella variicola subsp. variicola]|nr:hypothetical protein [Klebsiella variicola subsp. variicola]